ncbi:E3 SUMO-protein ligase NSE2 [Lepeophtheirus salmonis]|nr:E3 SUMO-protein ligase NSE2-like [Lepeophtheirus salmonis]
MKTNFSTHRQFFKLNAMDPQQKKHYQTGMDLLLQSARTIYQEQSEELRPIVMDALREFKSLTAEYLKSTQEFQLKNRALNESQFESHDESLSPEERYAAKYKDLQVTYNDDYFSKDPRYKEIEKMMENDSDILVTKSSQSLIDPITKATIVSPVKNPHCGHVYDRQSVTSWVNTSKKPLKCPIASCPNKKPIQLKDLEEDKALKKRILAMKK